MWYKDFKNINNTIKIKVNFIKYYVNLQKIHNANQLNIYLKTIFKPMVNKFITIGFLSEIE